MRSAQQYEEHDDAKSCHYHRQPTVSPQLNQCHREDCIGGEVEELRSGGDDDEEGGYTASEVTGLAVDGHSG